MKYMHMRKGFILPIALMAFAIVAFLFFVDLSISPKKSSPTGNANRGLVACTDEAKLCPDGTYVGRTGPNCAFAPCPSTNVNSEVNANVHATVNTNTTNTNRATNQNTNRAVSEVLMVYFTDQSTHAPIVNVAVQLYTDNGVRCVQAPCSTNGRTWTGTTNERGQVVIPANFVDQSMTFTLTGYQAKELHVGGTQQADGSWILPLTKS